MRIKLDENLPAQLVGVLERYGHQADTVPDEHLTGQPDERIWKTVCTESRFLITQDLDFSDSRRFTPGSHPGLLLVRLRELGARALVIAIEGVAGQIDSWGGCFVVLTDNKVRVKAPQSER
jgi:predicted nuclease of predicted toxin-antitoxin system